MVYHSGMKLFYVNLVFPLQLLGTPQAHFLHQEVCKCNFENYKLIIDFSLHSYVIGCGLLVRVNRLCQNVYFVNAINIILLKVKCHV
jgi:hypothetical protein